ncbi:MAG: alanine racemase [Bacillota bacterium]|nr:alanine racemase [Bacillota bacterium]
MKRLVVETDKIQSNIDIIKKYSCGAKLIAVVKGNGYGLGLVPLARIVEKEADMLAVSTVAEAAAIRNAGIECEILVLTPTSLEDEINSILKYNLTAAIGNEDSAIKLEKAASEANVNISAHLLFDTGFGRDGFMPEDIDRVISLIKSLKYINITGTFSHLYASFSKNFKLVDKQYNLFTEICNKLQSSHIDPGMRHIANSCAVFLHQDKLLDAVRVGSALVGKLPLKETYGLQSVGYLECTIDNIRKLPPSHNVGYGDVFKTKKETVTALADAGYADGLNIKRAGDAFNFKEGLRGVYRAVCAMLRREILSCEINGKKAYALGRVCMLGTILDITDINCNAGDIAIFRHISPMLVSSEIPREYR